ncbi:MAG: hypothetical protein Q9162_005772 [Coniocarpon cinnabarinum]
MDARSSGKQLPQFQIPSLQPSRRDEDTDNPHDSSPVASSGAHAFKMRKASYDKLIKDAPAAALSYTDLDDGDKITVGSGIELEDRLHEPRPKDTAIVPHQFDIDLSSEAHRVWNQRAFQEHQDAGLAQDSPAKLEQEAVRLKRDLSDRIGRLAAQMKSANIEVKPEESSVPGKAPAKASSQDTDPRRQYFRRSQPPFLAHKRDAELNRAENQNERKRPPMINLPPLPALPEAVALGQQPTDKEVFNGKGTLTPQGTKLAQQAGAAISRLPLLPTKEQTPLPPQHADRWASYCNMSGSFKYPTAELATGSPVPRAELDAKDSGQQSLLQMFHAELAKISKPPSFLATDGSSGMNDDGSIGSSEKARSHIADQPNVNLSKQGGQTLSRILSAQTSERDPERARRLGGAGHEVQDGHEIAKRASEEAFLKFKKVVETSRQQSRNVMQAQNAVINFPVGSESGKLAWMKLTASDEHGMACTTKCHRGNQSCPVRRHIKELAQKIQCQDNDLPALEQHRPECRKSGVLERGTFPKSHQATQTMPPKQDHEREEKTAFEADKILAKRYLSYNHMCGPTKLQYLIHWVGHGSEHDVWYDAENLGGCRGLVDLYERALQGKSVLRKDPLEPSKDELHAIHLRTAGDRTVASRKWEEAWEIVKHRESHMSAAALQKQHMTKVKTAAAEPAEPANVEARSSSLDTPSTGGPSVAGSQSTLRHRKSWHPSSTPTPLHRAISPMAVAQEKYPAIANFEAAHHQGKDDRRKSVPNFSSAPYPLDFPQASDFSPARCESTFPGPSTKDKSVRFAAAHDPWVEKEFAQAAWHLKQDEEESLYGAPEASTSAKKEGKKPARYSSPPPPKSVFASESSPDQVDEAPSEKKPMSSGDIWRELAHQSSIRRAKSLNFHEKRMAPYASRRPPLHSSPLRFASSDDISEEKETLPKLGFGPSGLNVLRSTASSTATQAQHETPALRRVASARLPHSLNTQAPSAKRLDDLASSRLPSHLARSRSDAKPSEKKPGPAFAPRRPDVSIDPFPGTQASLGNAAQNLEDEHYKRTQTIDPWAFLNESMTKDKSTALKYPAMTPSKPAAVSSNKHTGAVQSAFPYPPLAIDTLTYPPRPANPHLQFMDPPHRPSPTSSTSMRNSLPTRISSPPPAVKARNSAIQQTVEHLVSMGYAESQARFVAEGANGDMGEALDMLQEDQQARHEGFGASFDERAREAARCILGDRADEEAKVMRRMPGAF